MRLKRLERILTDKEIEKGDLILIVGKKDISVVSAPFFYLGEGEYTSLDGRDELKKGKRYYGIRVATKKLNENYHSDLNLNPSLDNYRDGTLIPFNYRKDIKYKYCLLLKKDKLPEIKLEAISNISN